MNADHPTPEPSGIVEERLRELSQTRYLDFCKLTSALSFGGLMFLLAFEKDYVKPESHYAWLVDSAWFFLALSSLTSLGLQLWFVMQPVWRWENKFPAEHDLEGERVIVSVLPWKTPFREHFLFWSHMAFLFLALIALMSYKVTNLPPATRPQPQPAQELKVQVEIIQDPKKHIETQVDKETKPQVQPTQAKPPNEDSAKKP